MIYFEFTGMKHVIQEQLPGLVLGEDIKV